MANYTLTPNMSLLLPTVGAELGPNWANDLNGSLSLLDGHDHSTGKGVPITPAGLNINSDLAFNNSNAITLRTTRFSPQSNPLAEVTDLGCLYVAGVDLFYNDGNSNQIRITNAGGIAGTSGSIGGLTSPASATYISATPAFVFQSAANTPANLDGGSLTLRRITPGSFGITLTAPVALAGNYSVTLPASLPPSQSFVTMDSSGNVSTPITFAQGITKSNLAPLGQQVSSSCGAFTLASGTDSTITNLTITITTTGRPVRVVMQPDGTTSSAFVQSVGNTIASISLFRGATRIAVWDCTSALGGSLNQKIPVGMFDFVDISAAAGSNTYTMKATVNGTFGLQNAVIIGYEL